MTESRKCGGTVGRMAAAACAVGALMVAGTASVLASTLVEVNPPGCSYSTELLTNAGAAGLSVGADCGDFSVGQNTDAEDLADAEAFGSAGWSFEEVLAVDPDDFDGTINGMKFSIALAEDGKSGTWFLNNDFFFPAGEDFAFVLKAATTSFTYLVDTSAGTSGTWSTVDITTPGQGNQQPTLSNIRLIGTAAPSVIPLPAAGWLLLGGLGALGALGHRRRKQAA